MVQKNDISETIEVGVFNDDGDVDDIMPTVTNSFYDSDLRMALSDLTAETGIPIITDPQVHGFITADFFDVPLEVVLEQILIPNGFTYRNMGDYYLVGSVSSASASHAFISSTKRYPLRYLRAEQLEILLPDVYLEFVRIDRSSNVIMINASPIMIDQIMGVIDVLDVLPAQYLIEAEVLEMGDAARRVFGINWDITGASGSQSFVLSQLAPDALEASLLGEGIVLGEDGPYGFLVDRRTAINALANNGLVKVIANPRLTTQQGQAASIRIGKEAYFNLLGESGAYVTSNALEKISTGVQLTIVPFGGKGSQITTELDVEVSDVIEAGDGDLPVTSVRTVSTRSTVANGHTFGVGGLLLESEQTSRIGIPFLSEIPILGYLFGQTVIEKEETEVVVLITPHVLLSPDIFRDL